MKRTFIAVMLVSLVLSGCGTYTGSSAYMGGTLGSILGSAIGGIADGPRGSDIGTIVGMAGGAVIGGVLANAQETQRAKDIEDYRRDKAERAAARAQRQSVSSNGDYQGYDQDAHTGSGFDETNSGDDRIYDFTSSDYTGEYSAQQPETSLPMESSVDNIAEGLQYSPSIEIRKARFVDDNQDGMIERGELSKIIFEVVNRGETALYDVQPTVVEVTGNKHIYISPNMHIEKIMPGKGIRYTALVKADNRLKAGTAKFCVSVIQGNKAMSKVSEFNIPTKK
jgi:outer membrane lipoprotein SlyB